MSILLEEALELPEVVERQLADPACVPHLAASLASQQPDILMTIARGGGEHAAHYFSALALSRLGLPAPPLQDALPAEMRPARRLKGLPAIAFSQTGRHPDLTKTVIALGALGARTIAFTNAGQSPLVEACMSHVPLLAGHEAGAVAMKAQIGMLSRSAQLVGYWTRIARSDRALLDALQSLPQVMARACLQDWDAGIEHLPGVGRLYIVAGASAMGVAHEAALTLMVTCGIRADTFSCSALVSGAVPLFERNVPVLVLAPRGPEQSDLLGLAAHWRSRDAPVLLAAPLTAEGVDLPLECSGDAALDPIVAMQSLYIMAARLAEESTRPIAMSPHTTGYADVRPVARHDVSGVEV